MKSNKLNYLIVGCFVLTMLVGLIVSIGMLTGRTGATDPYHAVYTNVTGLKYGTQVLYEGFPIGQVEEITPFEDNGRMKFRIDLSVQEGWKIPKDSTASISAPGLLSAIVIAIHAGNAAENLEKNSLIPSQESANMMAAISSAAGTLADLSETTLKPLLANLNRTVLVFGDLLDKEAGDFIKGLSEVTNQLQADLPQLLSRVDNGVAQIEKVLSDKNMESVSKTLGNAEIASKELASLTRDLQKTRKDMDKLITGIDAVVADNRLDIDKTIVDLRYVMESTARRIDSINQNLEGSSRNFYEFSRQIRQNPGLLLGGSAPKDAAR